MPAASVPRFRVQLSDFEVANGIDLDLKPFNFKHTATIAGDSDWNGRVVMTAPVDEDKAVQLFATDDVVSLPNAGIVRVEAGKSEANFVGHVADVVTSTDVTVIA